MTVATVAIIFECYVRPLNYFDFTLHSNPGVGPREELSELKDGRDDVGLLQRNDGGEKRPLLIESWDRPRMLSCPHCTGSSVAATATGTVCCRLSTLSPGFLSLHLERLNIDRDGPRRLFIAVKLSQASLHTLRTQKETLLHGVSEKDYTSWAVF